MRSRPLAAKVSTGACSAFLFQRPSHGTVAIFVPARGQHTLVQPVQPVLGRVGLGCCGGEQQGGGKKGAGEKSHIDLRGWQADA